MVNVVKADGFLKNQATKLPKVKVLTVLKKDSITEQIEHLGQTIEEEITIGSYSTRMLGLHDWEIDQQKNA